MTPTEFKDARNELGLSANKMAQALGLADGRTVRRYEAGDRPIPGPVIIALGYMIRDHEAAD